MNNFWNNKKTRIAIIAIADAIVVMISAVLALILRFDWQSIPLVYLTRVSCGGPIYIVAAIIIIGILKLYNRVWTYSTFTDFIDIVKASLLIEAIIVTYHVLMKENMPRSYYFLDCFFMIIGFSCVRFAKTIIKTMRNSGSKKAVKKRIMIIGAGAAASILIRELEENDEQQVICAIDDNLNKKNKYIMRVPIVGTRNDIIRNVKKYDITDIIIAMPSATQGAIRDVISICQETQKNVKILPRVEQSLTSSLSNSIRPVKYEDLLGREPIDVDHNGIKEFIKDKVILVTGGGGSIGSELCRQIIKYNPKRLIIFDIYENNAYSIQMELERHYPNIDISTLIGSIRDYDRMETVFKKYKPDIVYHAAAHKHVPLMEKSPNEAVKNNCLGTLNVAKLASEYNVSNFILISTDKAVRPTNIMGATKRVCEMIVQGYAKKTQNTNFAAVRFGNVLGSNGSVIPLFLKQIEEGGPVTVTDKEITRFFMTIPEAVSLVLQAGLYAHSGEIFVLDMGKPVKIYDLAENLIKLNGYVPGVDIKIDIIGLRPGEKLYEEILMDEEGLEKTANNMIYIGKPLKMNEKDFFDKLDILIREAMKNGDKIKEKMENVCETYTITNND